MIDISKKYQTRIWDPVTLTEIDPREDSTYRVKGIVHSVRYDCDIHTSWMLENGAWDNRDTVRAEWDLIEIKEDA